MIPVFFNEILIAGMITNMDYVRLFALLAHPILAVALIIWMWKQYSWRKKSNELRGHERKLALEKHETNGKIILYSGFAVVLIAFIGRMIAGYRSEGDIFAEIWPTSLHGFIGPLGLVLLVVMTNLGQKAKQQRDAKESFNQTKIKHGRAADLIMIFIFIHGFLGFLYIFSVI